MLAHGVVKCAIRFVSASTTTTTAMSMYVRKWCSAESCPTSGWGCGATALRSDMAGQSTVRMPGTLQVETAPPNR